MTIEAKHFPYQGDLLIANAARGTHGKHYDTWSDAPRTPRSRSDSDLLRDLGQALPIPHELPFRHAHQSLICRAPIPVARQLGKHQVGFDWSEISRRLKTSGLTFHRVGHGWRAALQHYAQGSGEPLGTRTQALLAQMEDEVIGFCLERYERALELGAAPEQARFLLPQSMEAVWVWTGSLLGWSELYRKRSHKDTQAETRDFVVRVAEIMKQLHPVGWEALRRETV